MPPPPINLTANAITSIIAGDLNAKPLVQVMEIRQIGAQQRFRLLISDSVMTQHAMLATQLNDRVNSAAVRKGSVIQLLEYICSAVQNRKIIVILNMETIMPECETIGKPMMLAEFDSVAGNQVPDRGSGPKVMAGNYNMSAQNNGNYNMSAQNNARASFPTVNKLVSQNASSNEQNFRPVVQPSYQPPPTYKAQGAIMKNDAPARIIPISALNPYQGRWAIKARVTAKGDLRRYNNAKGDGKVFSFDLLDSDGGEIRVTCFNNVVDRFYDTLEVGRVYVISRGSIKPAQKNFNHLKNEWEIFLEATSGVDLCPDEDASIPHQQFAFRPISEIETAENNSILDIIGVVTSVNPSVPILRKNGMETQRRIIHLKDQSGRSVELTLWGDFCNREGQKLHELIEAGSCPVLAVKAGKVNDFSGKSIGTISSTQLFINLECPEANALMHWFEQGGKDIAAYSISREAMPGGVSKNEIRKAISQIKNEGLGRSNKPDWITVRATVTFIKTDTFCYTACPLMIGDRQCNKKVTRSGNSRWQCDRCNQEFEECDYRYLLQVQISDHSGLTWVTAFQETGADLLGCSAKELNLLKEEDEPKFSEIVKACLFREFLMKLKVKEETYGDEQRVKITVIKADNVDSVAESRFLLDLISKVHYLR